MNHCIVYILGGEIIRKEKLVSYRFVQKRGYMSTLKSKGQCHSLKISTSLSGSSG